MAKATKVTAKKKKKPAKEPETPKRIRMLRSLANSKMAYTTGKSYEVGKDVSPDTAKSWIDVGAAEEDRAIDKAPETK